MTNAVEIKDLYKTYKNGTVALNGINLTIKSGDFFGLLGANGAGKTTIIGILTNLVNKTSGTAKVFGLDLDKQMDEAKLQIGVVPQEFNFNIFEKVIDVVANQAGYFGVSRKEAYLRAEEILKALDLWEKKDVVSRTLSGGMKRRLMIARSLVHRPRLLILDEPTAGVDTELRHGMWDYLRKLNQSGTTILLTTHYLEEAEQMCKNVAIINKGEIIKNDSLINLISSISSELYIVETDKAVPAEIQKKINLKEIETSKYEIMLGKNHSISKLTEQLQEAKIQIVDIRPKGNRLEQLYLNILQK
jgi:ABC-2 type transport system ATP-binding protein